MNTRMFRQVSLARLASPEQLDQVLRVTGPKVWAGLAALFILLTAAVVWGYTGVIVTTASGQGVIVRRGGVLNVVTLGGGLVSTVNAKVGDRVVANQVVATVSQPVLLEKRKAMRQALDEALREREQALQIGRSAAKLGLDALERQRANTKRQIGELEEEAKLATEQITVQEQLLSKGLVTRQQAVMAKQKQVGIQDQIAALKATLKQLDAQQFTLESQPQQEDAQMRERISVLERDLAGAEKELSMAENVVSPYGGQVLELKVFPGSAVAAGQPILSIQPDAQNLELMAYLPSIQAKDTKIGTQVQISPSTIKREEFGFMKGHVVYVSDFPATPAALMRNFANESLVTALTLAGPVNEVRVALDPDPATPSGFQWSTSRSPEVLISSGTMCAVQIVTRRQKPVTWVFPYIKSKLGLE